MLGSRKEGFNNIIEAVKLLIATMFQRVWKNSLVTVNTVGVNRLKIIFVLSRHG